MATKLLTKKSLWLLLASTRRLAIRAEATWLPILVEPSVGGFACGTLQFGGCLLVLNGERVSQFLLTIGPVVRF